MLYLDLKPLLTPDAVTELVMASMKNVPATQPAAFGASYTPIAAAGTDPQVRKTIGKSPLVIFLSFVYVCAYRGLTWLDCWPHN